MKPENIQAVMEFIFKGFKPSVLVLGQESCMILTIHNNKAVMKPINHVVNQYLKVLKFFLWDHCMSMVGFPYDKQHVWDNTLMVDNNLSKDILNITSNFIVCLTWMVGKVQDCFLLELVQY